MDLGRHNKRVYEMRAIAQRDAKLLCHCEAILGGNVADEISATPWSVFGGPGGIAVAPGWINNGLFSDALVPGNNAITRWPITDPLECLTTQNFSQSCRWNTLLDPVPRWNMGVGPDAAVRYLEVFLEAGAPDQIHVVMWDAALNASFDMLAATVWPQNVWNHVELCRYEDTLLLFLNGVHLPWTTVNVPFPAAFDFGFGLPNPNAEWWFGAPSLSGIRTNAIFDEGRICIGHASHLSDFIPLDREYTPFDL